MLSSLFNYAALAVLLTSSVTSTPLYPSFEPRSNALAQNVTLCGSRCDSCSQAPADIKPTDHKPRIQKRAFRSPSEYDDLDAFMIGETELAYSQGSGVSLVPQRSTSVAVRWGAESQNVAVAGLFGCATLILASTEGAYMTHFWEAPSLAHSRRYFEEDIIEPLVDGSSHLHGLNQLSESLFAPDQPIRGWLVSVSAGPQSSSELYRMFMGDIEEEVRKVFPGISFDRKTYARGDADAADSAKGKVLLQYDPDHSATTKAFRLYIEGKRIKTQAWQESE